MTNKNKMILGTAGALVLGLLAGTYLLSGLNRTSFAQIAPFTNIGRHRTDDFQNCADQDFQAIQSAIENKDYDAWVELNQKYADQKQAKAVNWQETIDSQEKFEKFTQMKRLMENGDFQQVQILRQKLGLPMGPGMGRGMGQGRFPSQQ